VATGSDSLKSLNNQNASMRTANWPIVSFPSDAEWFSEVIGLRL
jgi:hypothetical protein